MSSSPQRLNSCEGSRSSHAQDTYGIQNSSRNNIDEDADEANDNHGTTHPVPITLHHHHHNDNVVVDSMTPYPTTDMRARMTLALQDHLQDRPDIQARYEHTLSIEGSSPKPCIVPGNALQLIDDDPDAPRSPTPQSIIIIAPHGDPTTDVHISSSLHDEPSTPETSSVEPDIEQEQEEGNGERRRPLPRVRFRSRVRITSGLRKHRHPSGNGVGGSSGGHHQHPHGTPSSSASGSPSSSISAPLRWQADENATWGPLGRRLSAYAHVNGWTRGGNEGSAGPGGRPKHERNINKSPKITTRTVDERAPLMRSGRRSRGGSIGNRGYLDRRYGGASVGTDEERARLIGFEDESMDEIEDRAAALREAEEAVFGKWPWRIFNRHWWWWHMEPILCCCCSDDSDFEE